MRCKSFTFFILDHNHEFNKNLLYYNFGPSWHSYIKFLVQSRTRHLKFVLSDIVSEFFLLIFINNFLFHNFLSHWDVVISTLCLEFLTDSFTDYCQIVARISSIVCSNGFFIMAVCIIYTFFYFSVRNKIEYVRLMHNYS